MRKLYLVLALLAFVVLAVAEVEELQPDDEFINSLNDEDFVEQGSNSEPQEDKFDDNEPFDAQSPYDETQNFTKLREETARYFIQMDKNEDDFVSLEEALSGFSEMSKKETKEWFKHGDKNGDGKISLEEMLEDINKEEVRILKKEKQEGSKQKAQEGKDDDDDDEEGLETPEGSQDLGDLGDEMDAEKDEDEAEPEPEPEPEEKQEEAKEHIEL
eukprot:TRINITY_DN2586_c0_g1_i1.p1 TRINITY_DN2586_c0_g1~~TRINITY_DN2586_c0_g1_i1.p1  ORF type:complete len:215 (+),score=86.10 TRINITY_DN2586_c0_g1_i1:124-768(+)